MAYNNIMTESQVVNDKYNKYLALLSIIIFYCFNGNNFSRN